MFEGLLLLLCLFLLLDACLFAFRLAAEEAKERGKTKKERDKEMNEEEKKKNEEKEKK